MTTITNGSQRPHGSSDAFPDEEDKTEDQILLPDAPPQDDAADRPRKARRGFAAMDRKLVSAIASKGGRAAHAKGTAHQFTSEEAREAGRKGGIASHAARRLSPAPTREGER